MMRLWDRLPAIVRAIIICQVIVDVGGLPPAALMLANLKLTPNVPWFLPATGAWLWLFWRYADGSGSPRSTALDRHRLLRALPLRGRVWGWSLLAGSLGLTSVLGLAFLTPRLANIPRDAFKLPLDFSTCPPWTVVAVLAAISLTAGVVEEAGYRGYMLSLVEERHGWIFAIAITGLAFFLDHYLSHAYATIAFLPFFLAVSTVHGILVWLTKSTLPSVVLHALFDFLVIPVQSGLIGNVPMSQVLKTGLDTSFRLEVAVTFTAGIAAALAFRQLAAVAHRQAPLA